MGPAMSRMTFVDWTIWPIRCVPSAAASWSTRLISGISGGMRLRTWTTSWAICGSIGAVAWTSTSMNDARVLITGFSDRITATRGGSSMPATWASIGIQARKTGISPTSSEEIRTLIGPSRGETADRNPDSPCAASTSSGASALTTGTSA